MFAIYSGAFWNSTQLPETNAFTQHRSRIDNSCNRGHLVPSRGPKIRGTRSQLDLGGRSNRRSLQVWEQLREVAAEVRFRTVVASVNQPHTTGAIDYHQIRKPVQTKCTHRSLFGIKRD